MLADLASSVGVVVAALLLLLAGWELADPIASLLIGGLVLASTTLQVDHAQGLVQVAD